MIMENTLQLAIDHQMNRDEPSSIFPFSLSFNEPSDRLCWVNPYFFLPISDKMFFHIVMDESQIGDLVNSLNINGLSLSGVCRPFNPDKKNIYTHMYILYNI